MFKPPVEEAVDVVGGGLSMVLDVLTGDGVTTGMLVDVLLLAGVRIGVVTRGCVLAFA